MSPREHVLSPQRIEVRSRRRVPSSSCGHAAEFGRNEKSRDDTCLNTQQWRLSHGALDPIALVDARHQYLIDLLARALRQPISEHGADRQLDAKPGVLPPHRTTVGR